MSDELMVLHGSPTLAGLKTGNLFSCKYEGEQELKNVLRSWNHRLSGKGVRIIPMRVNEKRVLIYVYRPEKLQRDFEKMEVKELLLQLGYPAEAPEKCIVKLIERIHKSEEFPHEIGLFLGYPAEDVKGFIEHEADGYKCSGCWKVYGDEKQAKRQFGKYKKCTNIYCAKWRNGRSIEKLTVCAEG